MEKENKIILIKIGDGKMRKNILSLIVFCYIFCCPLLASTTQTHIYLLGDIDNFNYNGSGSIDDVYIDPVWKAWIEADTFQPIHSFDSFSADHQIPFTFLYELGEGENIISATLTFGLQAPGAPADTDGIFLDNTEKYYTFENIGWLPIPTYEICVRTLDLASIEGDNILSSLQDGQLNVRITDDTCVDYAQLTLITIPEPTTCLLLLGALPFIRKNKK